MIHGQPNEPNPSGPIQDAGLDQWLHCGVQLRHDGYLAHDQRKHADRNPALKPHTSIDAEVWPEGSLKVLSQFEVDQLQSSGENGLYPLLRRCMLAVLNSGNDTDDARELLRTYRDFQLALSSRIGAEDLPAGAPGNAFVDGKMIRGTRELLFSVLRDIVYTETRYSTAAASTSRPRAAELMPFFTSCETPSCWRACGCRPDGLLGRPRNQPRRIRLHQAGWL